MGNYYSIEYANLWMGIKETAFRTNAHGKDTANEAGDTFRRFPIRWDGAIKPRPLSYKVRKQRAAGKGIDFAHAYRDGYEPIKFQITGEVLDFAFIYQLCACTTAGSYTHTYATSTTQAQATFQMLQKIVNITGAESEYFLYIGCKITDFICSWNAETGRINGTLTIECATQITGLALTNEPTWIQTIPYYFNPLTMFVWTATPPAGTTNPGAHTYNGFCAKWRFKFSNGQHLRLINYLIIPDKVIENYRTIELEWDWVTEEKQDYEDSQEDPQDDQDQDLVHTLSNGVNSMVMTWAKMLIEYLGSEYNYKDFFLANTYRASLNPNQTSTLTMVETNSDTNVFYEGA